jgi:hypothetical protein
MGIFSGKPGGIDIRSCNWNKQRLEGEVPGMPGKNR